MFDPTKKPGQWGNKDISKGYRPYIVRLEDGGWERYEQSVTVDSNGNTKHGNWHRTVTNRQWLRMNL